MRYFDYGDGEMRWSVLIVRENLWEEKDPGRIQQSMVCLADIFTRYSSWICITFLVSVYKKRES